MAEVRDMWYLSHAPVRDMLSASKITHTAQQEEYFKYPYDAKGNQGAEESPSDVAIYVRSLEPFLISIKVATKLDYLIKSRKPRPYHFQEHIKQPDCG